MTRVTESLKWVVEINSDYPAMIEIDKVDAKAHLEELATLRAENERMRGALKPFAKAHDGRRRGDIMGSVCFKQEDLKEAKEALK